MVTHLRITQVGRTGALLLATLLAACTPSPTTAPPGTTPSATVARPAAPPTGAASPVVSAASPVASAASPSASPAASAPASSQEFDRLVADAKREGSVVLFGPPSPDTRTEIPRVFGERYGIKVEYVGGRSAELFPKLQAERAAGIFAADVWIEGATTFIPTVVDAGILDPLDDVLVDPSVTDASKWVDNHIWWKEPGKRVLGLSSYAPVILYANKNLVPEGSITSWQHLLDPKWRGKITCEDPTVPGSGAAQAFFVYGQLGEDYFKRLYVGQQLACQTDVRQQADGLARGVYALSVGLNKAEFDRVQADGLPVYFMPNPPEAPGYTTSGFGNAALLKQAPHPNAARLFINWIASAEGMTTWGKSQRTPVVRKDVDNSWSPPEIIPRPGVKYLDFDDLDTLRLRNEFTRNVKTLLAS